MLRRRSCTRIKTKSGMRHIKSRLCGASSGKGPPLRLFHPTPPGSLSLLRVSTETEEDHRQMIGIETNRNIEGEIRVGLPRQAQRAGMALGPGYH